jgi:hypothetical protein
LTSSATAFESVNQKPNDFKSFGAGTAFFIFLLPGTAGSA